ncbi:MAG: YggS family pyridoxal phosphate-dependent enzyme [Litoricola sp.]|jgi:pyridoxal phosphate enzyme (YggS family)|nr:YggS family pyridoxal phosphate-dependent enzyme [Litorivicinus sp.]
MDRATELKQHLTVIDTAIREAASACGRDPESIQLLAVSKTKPSSDIQMLHALGQRSFGENYVQEAVDKIHELQGLDIEWHYIGHIQSNKTKVIATEFDWVHTVDREKIASRLNDARDGDPLNILIQVNVDLAETKSGVSPTDLKALAMAIWKLPHLKLRGLMSIPDPVSENDLQRAHQQLRALFEEIKADHPTPEIFDTLSMGMTNDLELAISEGSTMVRIGTALFGARAPKETL